MTCGVMFHSYVTEELTRSKSSPVTRSLFSYLPRALLGYLGPSIYPSSPRIHLDLSARPTRPLARQVLHRKKQSNDAFSKLWAPPPISLSDAAKTKGLPKAWRSCSLYEHPMICYPSIPFLSIALHPLHTSPNKKNNPHTVHRAPT